MTVFVFFLRPFFQILGRHATLNENGARSQPFTNSFAVR